MLSGSKEACQIVSFPLFIALHSDYLVWPKFKFECNDVEIFSAVSNLENKIRFFAVSKDNRIQKLKRQTTVHKGGVQAVIPLGDNEILTLGYDKTVKKVKFNH